MTSTATSATARALDVRRLTGTIGGEVAGVRLDELDDGTFAAVHAALLDHKVLFFRDQHLTDDQHLALTTRFGEPMVFPVARLLGGTATLSRISDDADSPPDADGWHTDITWIPDPPKVAVLAALTIPPYGGDTCWADMEAVYDSLSEPMKVICQQLELRHTPGDEFVAAIARTMGDDVGDRVAATFPGAVHPLVRTHPETGRRSLFLSKGFVRAVVGMHPDESVALLAHLDGLVDDPKRFVRWRWTEGDVAIWDERSTQHRALGDHFPQERMMRRATVCGDEPFFRAG